MSKAVAFIETYVITCICPVPGFSQLVFFVGTNCLDIEAVLTGGKAIFGWELYINGLIPNVTITSLFISLLLIRIRIAFCL